LAERLTVDEDAIVAELLAVQGAPVDVGGYYRPDDATASAVMRPSATFTTALDTLG
jgi:isocitrate dehydrogenase